MHAHENSIEMSSFNPTTHTSPFKRLCDEGGGSGALVPPGGREGTDGLVITRETVDTRLNQDKTAANVLA